jgi:hypothetical protein
MQRFRFQRPAGRQASAVHDRQRPRRRLLAAAVLSVSPLMLVASPVAAQETATVPATGQNPSVSPIRVPQETRGMTAPGCSAVRREPAKYRTAGKKYVACLERRARPPARSTKANADDIPAWCVDYAWNSWWIFREEGCGKFDGRIEIYDPQTKEQVGLLTYAEYNYLNVSAGVTYWSHKLAIHKLSATGLAVGTSVSGSTSCQVGTECYLQAGTFPSQAIDVGSARAEWLFRSRISAAGKWMLHQSMYHTVFTNPFWQLPGDPGNFTTPNVRCDNALPGIPYAGCTIPEFSPVLAYSLSGPYPEVAAHIQSAQRWLPWAYGRDPLTRETNQTAITANGNRACPSSLPRPPGKQCDEYAFRSTHQGAAQSGRWSAQMVNATQNGGAGNALKNFYNNNRIIEADKFFVLITS